MRSLAVHGAALALVALLVSTPVVAGETPIFGDGFEGGDPCLWSAIEVAPLVEGEPIDSRLNDDLANATPIGRCSTVDGTIGSPIDGGADFDLYRFEAAVPFLLRLTLEDRDETSDFEPYADVDDDDTLPLRGVLPDLGPDSSGRQIWIPAAGSWYLFVGDARNWDRFLVEPVDPATAGGADGTYRLRLEVDELEAPSIFPELDHEALEIPSDGSLVAYGITTGCQLTAETFAERLGSPSPLDTRLLLVRTDGDSPETIADNDDLSELTLDSRLENVGGVLGTYALIVDFVDSYDTAPALPAAFELSLALTLCAEP